MIRFAIALVLAAGIHLGSVIAEEDAQQATLTEFIVRPIGHVQKMGERIVIILDKKYRGVNPLLLACASARHNLHSRYWGTFYPWRQSIPRQQHRSNSSGQIWCERRTPNL